MTRKAHDTASSRVSAARRRDWRLPAPELAQPDAASNNTKESWGISANPKPRNACAARTRNISR